MAAKKSVRKEWMIKRWSFFFYKLLPNNNKKKAFLCDFFKLQLLLYFFYLHFFNSINSSRKACLAIKMKKLRLFFSTMIIIVYKIASDTTAVVTVFCSLKLIRWFSWHTVGKFQKCRSIIVKRNSILSNLWRIVVRLHVCIYVCM